MSETEYIHQKSANDLLLAANAAIYRFCPLNQFLTVHCPLAGISLLSVHDFITRFAKGIGDWLRYRDIPLSWIWALENPPMHGLNWHLILHVPDDHREAFKHVYRE